MMPKTLDFYFDFSSPYAYLASTQIDALATDLGRQVQWFPILLGPMFQAMGSAPLVDIPLKGAYARHDFSRTALLFGIDYREPDEFPIATVAAARAAWFLRSQDMALAGEFSRKVLQAYFADQQDIRDTAVLASIAESVGADSQAMLQAMQTDAIKGMLKEAVSGAMERGVFGSPFIFIDNEGFWGFDRLPHIRMWAAANPA
ncbi:MAG TPA: 2-hydroxychromene-2-carboxylate isomerase [Burkholderiaceae bacterium]|nr:2-hydroxychromene-2-carboxylate isomerase [Burkholderiaceae bacterium]